MRPVRRARRSSCSTLARVIPATISIAPSTIVKQAVSPAGLATPPARRAPPFSGTSRWRLLPRSVLVLALELLQHRRDIRFEPRLERIAVITDYLPRGGMS